jgi:hypothetical protein
VKNRRSLTPTTGVSDIAEGGLHATRRGGARHEVSSRVTLQGAAGQLLEGWALNVSKGGVRVILEEKVDLGVEFEVTLAPAVGADSSASSAHNVGRVVWVQEEPDGVIAGIEFVSDRTEFRDTKVGRGEP